MEIIPHSYSAQVQCPFDPSSFEDFNFYPGEGRCALRVPESVKLGVVASDAQCLCSTGGQEAVNQRGNCHRRRYFLGFLASFLGLGGHIAKQTDSTAISSGNRTVAKPCSTFVGSNMFQLVFGSKYDQNITCSLTSMASMGAWRNFIFSQVFSRSTAVSPRRTSCA